MNYKISYLIDNKITKATNVKTALEVTSLSYNELLSKMSPFNYTITNDDVLSICSVTPLKWTEYYLDLKHESIELDIYERQLMIYLMLYSECYNLSVFHFEDFLRVSRGTILSDIKALRKTLREDNINLNYDRQRGYYLSGDLESMFILAQNYISELLDSDDGRFMMHYFVSDIQLDLYANFRDKITENINKTSYKFVPSRIDEIVYFSIFSAKKLSTKNLESFEELINIKELSLYSVASDLFAELYGRNDFEHNIGFYTICLLSILQGNIHEASFDYLLQLSAEIIHRMEKLAAIQFRNFRELLFNLYNHLVPAYFRIKYQLRLSNVLVDNIYSEYRSIFKLTEKALNPIERITNNPVSKEEIAYFTILFGGAINNENGEVVNKNQLRALIVCPNGISSSLILESELKTLFPSIQFKESESINGLKNISKDKYDFIFSTVPLESNKKVYFVKPIMNQLEKNKLINEVQKDWLIPGVSIPEIDEIFDSIQPYIDLKDGVDKEQIYRALNRVLNAQFDQYETDYNLKDLLLPENIQFKNKVNTWEDAIRVAAKPLLSKESINEDYVQAMLNSIHKYGAYIHMGNGIALPHASPEDGVYKTSFSLLKLEEPIYILDDSKFETNIIIVLSTVNNKEHLTALNELITLVTNKETSKSLLEANTKEEIIKIIKKVGN